MKDDADRMFAYLLGELPETERNQTEERYFADAETFDLLQAAEDDLVDAYVFGKLSKDRRARFEQRLLRTEEQRRRVDLARRLAAAAEPEPWVTRAWSYLTASRWPVLASSFAAAALVVAIGIWSARDRSAPLSATPSATTARVRQPALTTVPAFVILPGMTRDLDGQNTFSIPAGARNIRLEVRLDAGACGRCAAMLKTVEGADVWSGQNLLPAGRRLAIEIPRPALGDYILTLREAGSTEDSAEYAFRVR